MATAFIEHSVAIREPVHVPPVGRDRFVQVVTRDGRRRPWRRAGPLDWEWLGNGDDVVRYRVAGKARSFLLWLLEP